MWLFKTNKSSGEISIFEFLGETWSIVVNGCELLWIVCLDNQYIYQLNVNLSDLAVESWQLVVFADRLGINFMVYNFT